jgi:hypothetical protein
MMQKLSDKQKVAAIKELITNEPHTSKTVARRWCANLLLRMSRTGFLPWSMPWVCSMYGVTTTTPVLKQVKILRDLVERRVSELPSDFDISLAAPNWRPLLQSPDRKKALAALKACVMVSVRKEIKGGKLWLAHSRKHRDREDQLIPISDWQAMRGGFLSAMSLTADPEKYLARLCEKVQHSLSELATAVDEGRVTIDDKGICTFHPLLPWTLSPKSPERGMPFLKSSAQFSTANLW